MTSVEVALGGDSVGGLRGSSRRPRRRVRRRWRHGRDRSLARSPKPRARAARAEGPSPQPTSSTDELLRERRSEPVCEPGQMAPIGAARVAGEPVVARRARDRSAGRVARSPLAVACDTTTQRRAQHHGLLRPSPGRRRAAGSRRCPGDHVCVGPAARPESRHVGCQRKLKHGRADHVPIRAARPGPSSSACEQAQATAARVSACARTSGTAARRGRR